MTKHRYVLTISLILLPLVLFHFQNCAPAAPGGGNADSDGSKVGLVDNFNKSQIQFVSEDSQIQDEAKMADISGLCARAHDGAALKFTISDLATLQTTATGMSHCDHGQFSVHVEQLDHYPCGVTQVLTVEGDWGDATSQHFSRRCQPLVSLDEETPPNMPIGTTCSLEYAPSSTVDQPCLRVCYRVNQVVSTQPLDLNACSALAASVAGR